MYAGTSPENVQPCIDVILEQFGRVRDAAIDETELHLAKEHIKGNLTLSLESTSSRMIRLGRNEFAMGRQVSPEEIEQRIDAVTADEVQQLARELLATRTSASASSGRWTNRPSLGARDPLPRRSSASRRVHAASIHSVLRRHGP